MLLLVTLSSAGDVNKLLLDKTGTITIGNRQATEFLPVGGVTAAELADAAQPSSMADYTPEGRSIVVLAKEKFGLRERAEGELAGAEFVEFAAQTFPRTMPGRSMFRPRCAARPPTRSAPSRSC